MNAFGFFLRERTKPKENRADSDSDSGNGAKKPFFFLKPPKLNPMFSFFQPKPKPKPTFSEKLVNLKKVAQKKASYAVSYPVKVAVEKSIEVALQQFSVRAGLLVSLVWAASTVAQLIFMFRKCEAAEKSMVKIEAKAKSLSQKLEKRHAQDVGMNVIILTKLILILNRLPPPPEAAELAAAEEVAHGVAEATAAAAAAAGGDA